MDIKNVFVAGAGYMGNGIAQVSALAGYKVVLCDVSEACLASGLDAINSSLGKLLSKDKIGREQSEAALANIAITCDLEEAAGSDIAVEAIPERIDLKKDIFSRLDGICPPHAIIGTNTSAIPISSIASATTRPDKVVGIHFFGPVPLMKLVEVIKGVLTSQETMSAADGWARSLGKETVLVAKDHAGFVANRASMPSTIEAMRMIEEGMATPEEIDRATGGYDFGVGPLQIVDNAGLEVGMNAATAIYEDTRDPKFFPPPLLRRMVAAGMLGRKSGKGFYDYSSGKRESYLNEGRFAAETDAERDARRAGLLQRFIMPNMLEAVRLLEAGVSTAEDIDKAIRLGFNLPQGLLDMADNLGLDTVMEIATGFYEETGDAKFFPPPLLRRMVAAGMLGRKSGSGFYVYT
ncbi:MAG: 3-hydroxyacyl-CoA dehydrogenase [Actinobacteria bacterium]|nr:3-hydroxyacyl-CoA dehydrogenase [Actinomycetota bacterium]